MKGAMMSEGAFSILCDCPVPFFDCGLAFWSIEGRSQSDGIVMPPLATRMSQTLKYGSGQFDEPLWGLVILTGKRAVSWQKSVESVAGSTNNFAKSHSHQKIWLKWQPTYQNDNDNTNFHLVYSKGYFSCFSGYLLPQLQACYLTCLCVQIRL